jgi:hypothetical protein
MPADSSAGGLDAAGGRGLVREGGPHVLEAKWRAGSAGNLLVVVNQVREK